MKTLIANPIARLVLALVAGIAIGAIFYPNKTVTESEKSTTKLLQEREEKVRKELDAEYSDKMKLQETINKHVTESIEKKLEKTTQENMRLRVKTEEQIVKIIRPDGTIEEKTIRKSDTQQEKQILTTIKEEFSKKVTEIETRYKEVYTERLQKIKESFESQLKSRDEKIATYEKKKETKINDSNTRIGVGLDNEAGKYGLIERDIFGPVFIHSLIQIDNKNSNLKGGLGIGIKF